MSEREALYGTKLRQNREDRVLRLLKTLLIFSLSLSFDGDDSDKLILQLGRRASFTPLSIFCLRRRALLLLLLLCVLSFSLEDDDDDAARAGSKKARVFSMAQNKEKERKKREKEGETR